LIFSGSYNEENIVSSIFLAKKRLALPCIGTFYLALPCFGTFLEQFPLHLSHKNQEKTTYFTLFHLKFD
jgi:hypothetical protein